MTQDGLKQARFRELCASMRPDLLRFAMWLARDRAFAEDVVRETMRYAWKARDTLDCETAARPWLLTILRREYARSFERKCIHTADVDGFIVSEEAALADVDGAADVAQIRRALCRLPAEFHEPLVLQVLMGCSTAEIAAQLGLSNAEVLTRLFQARRLLRSICGVDTSLDPEG